VAQTFTNKQLTLASDGAKQATLILQAADALTGDAQILAQTGGNFVDPIFDTVSTLSYLSAYQANVFFQTIAPAFKTWLDTPVSGVAGSITYRQWFQTMVSQAV